MIVAGPCPAVALSEIHEESARADQEHSRWAPTVRLPVPPPGGTGDAPPAIETSHLWIEVGATLTVDELPHPPAAANTPHMAKTIAAAYGCQEWETVG